MRVSEATFKTCVFDLVVETSSAPQFVDITDRVRQLVRDSEIRNGIAVVYSKHTTAAVTIQENEPLLINDMASVLERFAPRGARYGHNDFSIRTVHMEEDECPNGHSHCQHLVLGASETIPVIEGSLTLGRYQRIFMVELDEEKVRREILVQILGM
jgi:secondary thiamine-phosphate synthase enzyme